MKKAILSIALSALFVGANLNASANDEVKKSSNVEFKMISNSNDQPVFQLDLNSAEAETFYITIKDNFGNTLYADKLEGKKISKKFKLNSEGINDDAIRVEVKTKKSNKAEVYTINRSSKYVQETVINKLGK